MGTRFLDQLNPNLTKNVGVRQTKQAASNDIWISQDSVINEFGFGQEDLWARLVSRHDELLSTGGIKADLWLQFDSGIRCSCIKDETGQVDQRCPVCYGVRFVGGFEKYGHQTLNVYGGDLSLTKTNIVFQEKRLPYPLVLDIGQTTGSILSPEYIITNNHGFTGFALTAQNHIRDINKDKITVEYTVDGGATFFDVSDATLLNEPTLKVQFRITMTRNIATEPSPFFHIFKARWKSQTETQVLISKKTFPEQRWLESFGVSVRLDGVTWWTTPNLGVVGGGIQRIGEDDFFQLDEGFYKPQTLEDDEFPHSGRMKPVNVIYVEPNAKFLSQRFNVRVMQSDEPEISVY